MHSAHRPGRFRPPMQDSRYPRSSASRGRHGLVLVVEYDPWVRRTLTGLFEEIGFGVTTASNGYAGLRLAGELRPWVVVLGDDLPEVSTAHVAAELRKLGKGFEIQIISSRELLSALPGTPVGVSPAGR